MKRILSSLCLLLSVQLSSSEISTWSSPPVTLSSTGVDASDPQIAMDANANAVTVWVESGLVKSSTLPLGGSWSAAATLSASGASSPQVAVDPSGNATAVWVESGIIKTADLPFGGTWSSSTTLSSSGSSVPEVCVRDNGDVVAVWVTSGVVQSNTKPFGGSWAGSPDVLSGSNADAPQVAVGSNGTVVATWHELNGVSLLQNVFATTKSIGGTWSAAATVSDPTINSVYPQVAVDLNGNATTVWFTYDLTGSAYSNVSLYGSALPSSGGSWSTPGVISFFASVRNPADLSSKVLYGTMGFPIVMWTASNDGSNYSIQTSQNVNNQGWIDTGSLGSGLYDFDIDMAVTAQNDAFSVYMDYDGSSFININSASSHIGGAEGGFWFNPTTISSGTTNGFPQLGAVITGGNTNNVVALWLNFDGTNNTVQAVTGTGTLVEPPSDPLITQGSNNFGIFLEYYNTFSWTASMDPNLVAYGIYRNNVLITNVSPDTLQYVENNVTQNGPVTYGVSALDSAGSESAVISASFP